MKRLLVYLFALLPIWGLAQSSPRVFINTQIDEAAKLQQTVKAQSLFVIADDKEQADFVLTIFLTELRNESKTLPVYTWNLNDIARRRVIASGEEISFLDCLPKVASAVQTGWQVRQQLGLDKLSNFELPGAGSGRGIGVSTGARSEPYVVGDGVTEPVAIANPRPAYTKEARQAHVEGVVVLQVIIRKDGTVDSFKVIKGLGYGLDESAIDTIMTKWKFKPGTLKGVPVDVLANIEVTFKL